MNNLTWTLGALAILPTALVLMAQVPNNGNVAYLESEIFAIQRDDQTEALRIGLIKKELILSDALRVLCTYVRVSPERYFEHAHQPGVRGSVTTRDGTARWEIEPDYAAVLIDSRGHKTYLLHPKLAAKGE